MMTIIPLLFCTFVLHVQADVPYDPIEHITQKTNYLIPALIACAAAAVLLTALTAVAAGLCIFVPAIIDKVTQLS